MTSVSSSATTPVPASIFAGLAPISIAVFLGLLAFSFPLGALSLEIGGRLGFDTVIVGSIIGLQSVATLLSRHQAQSTSIGTAFFVGAIATTAAVLPMPSVRSRRNTETA